MGGHSIDDKEPKYGLAVTGVVHPDRIITNDGGRPGDVLVLTKPIGTGIVATGIKQGRTRSEWRDAAVAVMAALNAGAARAMVAVGVSAATDVTGFGLLGHLHEMLTGGVGAQLAAADVPLLPGARDLAAAGVIPGGTLRNRAAVEAHTDFGPADDVTRTLLSDAQTSGGLLIAVSPERAAALLAALAVEGVEGAVRIGTLTDEPSRRISVL